MADDTDDRWRKAAGKLRGITVYRRVYHHPRPSWDHDHCYFCFAKFSDLIEEALSEGWATRNAYHWFCERCCDDFKEFLGWALVTDSPEH